ncbi:hypothetical protein [Tenuibacillus multivorans]|uniref:Stress protein n=1 Tax=Tenuibacillus multivorans TaxID=237069 RepID=A0A1H0CGJ4_9BACI|nr:hypothetical protein [Tenuibacillus multivorans]GEL76304.1 hypothetical protein TMU01_05390 [Tenuibacillus multivorans]SDN56990.1 hypothetical protein SAMN05216498_2530 [Tenuibacillus multivorans]
MKKVLMFFMLMTVLLLGACGGDFATHTVDDAVQAFKEAGLEVEGVREMTKDDYGIVPMKDKEGVRFLIPSLGENNGGRIMSFDNEDDLDEVKKVYDDVGKESAMLFTWTIKHKNILVQINGDLEESKYNEYVKALETLE